MSHSVMYYVGYVSSSDLLKLNVIRSVILTYVFGVDMLTLLDEFEQLVGFVFVASVARIKEGDGSATSTSAASPPNSVNVIVHIFGHIIIENVSDVMHVQSASRDVGGDHDLTFTGFEIMYCSISVNLIINCMYII